MAGGAEDEPRSGAVSEADAFMNGSGRNCYGWLAEQKMSREAASTAQQALL